MEKRFDVLVVGYSGYDLAIGPVPQNIMDMDSGIAPNRIITVGGDGINAATSFAHLGCKTAIATVVGRDMFAKTVMQHFADHGIATDYVTELADTPTALTLLLIGEDGERHCLIRDGARTKLEPWMIPDEALQQSRHVHYASFYPMVEMDRGAEAFFRRAKELGLSTSMDAVTPRGEDHMRYLGPTLKYIDVFMPSFDDAVKMFGTDDLQEMKAKAQPYGMKFFGVKLGAKGLFMTDFERDVFVPTMCKGTVVDTTGAGDSCAAGAAVAFLKGGDIEACAAAGCANAAHIIQSFGATTGCTTYENVAALAKEFGYDIP